MKSIDNDVLSGYNAGKEKGRLHNGLGLIEFERTKEILRQLLPPAPAVIYDIGGGYGEYAYYLTDLGYEVYLYDIAEKNIEMSLDLGRERGLILKAAEVADARSIDRPDNSADAILLFGPLYHIVDYSERQLCLKECYRLLKPNGLLFTAAITRHITTIKYVNSYETRPLIDDIDFYKMLETEIKTGLHTKKPMGLSHFHLPEELKAEIESAGFGDTDIRGVVGPCWMIRNLDEAWQNDDKRESIMRIVRLCEKEESIMGLSGHILSISKKELSPAHS